MASISASFVSVAPQKRAVNPSKTKCTSQTSVSSRAFSRGTSASFSGESVSCARLTQKMNGSNRGQRRVTTMAAKVAGYIKLAIEAGKANPAPPIGPALGAKVRFPSAWFSFSLLLRLRGEISSSLKTWKRKTDQKLYPLLLQQNRAWTSWLFAKSTTRERRTNRGWSFQSKLPFLKTNRSRSSWKRRRLRSCWRKPPASRRARRTRKNKTSVPSPWRNWKRLLRLSYRIWTARKLNLRWRLSEGRRTTWALALSRRKLWVDMYKLLLLERCFGIR